ncbi:P-loop containing nucleoside triphosphate hydrolase protein [Dactylonectria estremocensis]|uniref:P-loop containing nucleoside triphosphate hydrolase protein n=1 Tax=Dactylonectria estremocensis TaxID=1079267 RepID=A0A9P9J1L4_9HYPO|nr:P-loop containing nucleoside triphosphate hydrolase protein [Dactylonectria estremocensis]
MTPDPGPTAVDSTTPAPKQAERTPSYSDYFRIFSYATKWDFIVYVIASLSSIGAGITMPLMNVIFGQLVNQFTSYFGDASDTSNLDFTGTLNRQSLYIVALFLAKWALNAINKFCFRMIGIRLSSAIRHDYLRSLFAQSISVIDSMPVGAPATAITTTSNTLQLGISEHLGTFLQFNATIWAALIIAFIWSWDLTLVTLSLLLYMMIVLCVLLPLNIKGQTAMAQADAQANAIASEALKGVRLVMACGAQARTISHYEKWVREAMRRGQKIAPVMGFQFGLIMFGIFGAYGLTFWYGTKRFVEGAVSNAGVVIIVLMSIMMILTSLERVSTPLIAVSKAMIAACEFFTVIDAPPPERGSSKPDITSQDLVFQNVTFEYPSRPGVGVLDDLSFRIRSGCNTALVGPSGSGKSTIVGLVEGWYSLKGQQLLPRVVEATSAEKSNTDQEKQTEAVQDVPAEAKLSGSITVGSHNLEELDLKWWRSQIGLVQQEPFLFNDTIYGNVVNGLIGTTLEDIPEAQKRELVREACGEAYAEEFINRLPDGYETRVGDGGAKLSGGQKQRLAIARSIIKKPQIIILDEATSAIDAKSERLVQAALDKVTQHRTTITIAHRLSTIQKADHIIVLKNGRAVEEGTHQSLMADSSGVYNSLVQAQSLHLPTANEDAHAQPASNSEAEGKLNLSDDDMPTTQVAETSPLQTQKEQQPPSLFRIVGKLLYRLQAQRPLFIGILLSCLAIGAGTPLQAWLFAKAIQVFLLEGEDVKKEGSFWGLMWLALAGGVGLGWFSMAWTCLHAQYSVSRFFKTQYFTDMLHQKPSYFDEDKNSHGTLTSLVSGDAKLLEELFGLNTGSLLNGVFNAAGCIIISLIFSWKLGLVAMFATMPVMLTAGFWKYRYEIYFEKMNSAVFMESSQFATEAVGAMRTVSSLNMEDTINGRYQTLLSDHVHAARLKAQWTAGLFGFADSIGLACQALVLWYGGKLMTSGEISLEQFFVCFMAMIQGAESAAQVLSVSPNFAQAATAADRIFKIEESSDFGAAGMKGGGNIPASDGGVHIELRDVHFKYPTRDVSVFDGLSLAIKKGQYAAFVGPSGSGKTTIISLLERFYDVDPGRGDILCNDVNINDLNVYDYRRNLSLVAQEPTLFQGSIRDNILFGISDPSSVPDERIHEVCRDAFIHDFIVSLPEGYNTDVGQQGVSMSGGQRQRVAIARALIRDPKILLLDEATSALDSESEKIVQAAFEKAREGRTMIAVAHRLSTIQKADVIFVLDGGRVVEQGNHEDLVELKGVYWEMCQSQALDQ